MNKKLPQLWRMMTSFLNDYLTELRKLSPRTISTYKECLTDFSVFLRDTQKLKLKELGFEHYSRKHVVAYVMYMQNKGLKARTRNLRLAVIKSFLSFCADESIDFTGLYHEVKSIPAIKIKQDPIIYLTEAQMELLLDQPNPKTKKGYRDRILITFLYDSAVRVQELVNIQLGDLHINATDSFVTIKGQGNKLRNIPLMEKTISHLRTYIDTYHVRKHNIDAPLFYYCKMSGRISKLSTDAVCWMLKKYGAKIKEQDTSITVSIHPHLFRTTRAMHLYKRKMPIEYISKFLGHSSTTTTSLIYAYANLEMLSEALLSSIPVLVKEVPQWEEQDIMRILKS